MHARAFLFGVLLGGSLVGVTPPSHADHLPVAGRIITGPGAGGGPHLRGFTGTGGPTEPELMAFDTANTGGVRVATGDVDGDGRHEVIAGAGAGASHVKSFQLDGRQLTGPRGDFFAFSRPAIGVYVGAGDTYTERNHDEIVVAGNGPGGFDTETSVKVDASADSSAGGGLVVYEGWTGEIRLTGGDFDGDGASEVATAPGPGGGPHVVVLTREGFGSIVLADEFMAYDPGFAGGVYLGAGDLDGDGADELITGPGEGGGPHVRAWTLGENGFEIFTEFFAYDPRFTGGVRVAAGDVDGDNDEPGDEIVTGAGPGGGPHVRVFGSATIDDDGFFAYAPEFRNGIYVAVANPMPHPQGAEQDSGSG